MSSARYSGPERRHDGEAAILARLDEIKEHFDERMTSLEAKVNPMHEYFTTAKIGAAILKWALGVSAAIGALWTAFKAGLIK